MCHHRPWAEQMLVARLPAKSAITKPEESLIVRSNASLRSMISRRASQAQNWIFATHQVKIFGFLQQPMRMEKTLFGLEIFYILSAHHQAIDSEHQSFLKLAL